MPPSAPRSAPLPTLRAAAGRVLSLGAATLLGATLLYGLPSESAVRRRACAVAGCVAPTAPTFAAGRAAAPAATLRDR